MKKLVVGIYVDFMGMLSELSETDEYNEVGDILKGNLPDFNLMFIKLDTPMDADSHLLDILVVDYGGLSACMGFDASRMLRDFSLYMRTYIQDHPSVAVIIFSKMTETIYWEYVEEEIGQDIDRHEPNVFLFDRRPSSYCTIKMSISQKEGESLGEGLKRFIEG